MARQIDLDQLMKYPLRRGSEHCDEKNADPRFLNGVESVLEWAQTLPTLTPQNEWVSVYDRLPEPGERVLATDCGFVGEFYINKCGKWQRYNVNCSELLMALDILYWMPLPAPPDRRPPEGEGDNND